LDPSEVNDDIADETAELCADEYTDENDDDAEGLELIELTRLDSEPDCDPEADWLIDTDTGAFDAADISDDEALDDDEEKIDEETELDEPDEL
jgi:hypothetical protein